MTAIEQIARALDTLVEIEKGRIQSERVLAAGQLAWNCKQRTKAKRAIISLQLGPNAAQAHAARVQIEAQLEAVEHEIEWLKRRYPGIEKMAAADLEMAQKKEPVLMAN